jgi:two-component system response regulator RegA
MSERTRRIGRALVVEDDPRLRATLLSALGDWADEVRSCATAREAKAIIQSWKPQLLLIDYRLPDGTGEEVLRETAGVAPRPIVVALSAFARPAQSFALARLGVRAYLEKPIDLAALAGALDKALETPPDVGSVARDVVGQVGLRQIESEVRHMMVSEALARSGGNRRGAARLLRISRQLLQHVLRKPPGETPSA